VDGATRARPTAPHIRGKLVPELDRLIALAREEGLALERHVAALRVVTSGPTNAADASDVGRLSAGLLASGLTLLRHLAALNSTTTSCFAHVRFLLLLC
jgi:hypothetical protein